MKNKTKKTKKHWSYNLVKKPLEERLEHGVRLTIDDAYALEAALEGAYATLEFLTGGISSSRLMEAQAIIRVAIEKNLRNDD